MTNFDLCFWIFLSVLKMFWGCCCLKGFEKLPLDEEAKVGPDAESAKMALTMASLGSIVVFSKCHQKKKNERTKGCADGSSMGPNAVK